MIEVEVGQEEKKSEYPKLMIDTKDGCIVLFTENECGVIVKLGANEYEHLGVYYKDWKMEFFTPFNGTVTLKNK